MVSKEAEAKNLATGECPPSGMSGDCVHQPFPNHHGNANQKGYVPVPADGTNMPPPPSYSQVPNYSYPVQYHQGQPVAAGYPASAQYVVITPAPMENAPQDHMVFNIMMTIFCCWPIGIFGILKSMECRTAITRGERESAHRLSRDARRYGMWALGIGAALSVILIVIVIVVYATIIPQLHELHE